MRAGSLVLVTVFTLLASTSATESLSKNTFTLTDPKSEKAMNKQDDSKQYLILSKDKYDESDTAGNDSGEAKATSDGQEERVFNAEAAGKLKRTFSGKYNTPLNKFLWYFFRTLTPKDSSPTLPRRSRRSINPGNVS